MGLGQFGVDIQSRRVGRRRFVSSPKKQQRVGQVVMEIGVLGSRLNGLRDTFDALLKFTPLAGGDAKHVIGIGVVGIGV